MTTYNARVILPTDVVTFEKIGTDDFAIGDNGVLSINSGNVIYVYAPRNWCRIEVTENDDVS